MKSNCDEKKSDTNQNGECESTTAVIQHLQNCQLRLSCSEVILQREILFSSKSIQILVCFILCKQKKSSMQNNSSLQAMKD